MTGPIALVGSGEYLPVMTETERLLLQGGTRYVQIPTAAAPEGEKSLNHWIELGRKQAERLGAEAIPVVARNREEADSPELAALVEGADLVYLSGGNPPFLAATLRGTRLWEAVHRAWTGGAGLAGCSAGAMALTSWVPDFRHPLKGADPGLGAVAGIRAIPHFDRMAARMPDLVARYLVKATGPVVGIDEDTAMVRVGETWTVHGRQAVWLLTAEGRTPYRAGETVPV